MEQPNPKASAAGLEAKKRKEPPSSANASNGQNYSEGRPANARSQKRSRMTEARTIDAQPADAALKNGELDLQAFLNARAFEIAALEESMRKCKTANATRTFQKVPRPMRRRTASHNVKKIPKRLRPKARREQIEDNTPTNEPRKRRPRTTRARIRAETAKKLGILAERQRKKKLKEAAEKKVAQKNADIVPEAQTVRARIPKPKIRRNALNEPQKPKAKFRKRQISKTWLPTHLWHAKRARMTEPKLPLWRFAIPLTPTEKCYRPTHRASGDKGAVIWDMSYMSTIGLNGSEEGIERVLRAVGLTQEDMWTKKSGLKWRAGLRKWSGMLSREKKGGRKVTGPAAIIWNAQQNDVVMDDAGLTPAKKALRQVFIRVHPSCFLELFDTLLKQCKMQSPQLYIEDLRFEIGSIDLTGPGSTEALLAVLRPYHRSAEAAETHASTFESLAGLTNPATLPSDALLAFSVIDPRLRYPPRQIQQPEGNLALLETLTKWPVGHESRPHALFDREARFRAGQLPTQKSISRRKGQGVSGEPLDTTEADPPIPIILLASRPSTGGQAQGSWTLLGPWKCILPIWYSLVHYPLSTGGNPRFGGLNELRQVLSEQGGAWFPADFPGTEAGAEWEFVERTKRRAAWNRRPKNKRIEWHSVDLGAGRKGEIGDGLACDWEHLFDLPKDLTPAQNGADELRITVNADAMNDTNQKSTKEEANEPMGSKDRKSLSLINQLSVAAFRALSKQSPATQPPASSIVTVRLAFVGRGTATTCARIYRLPSTSPITAVAVSHDAEVPSTVPPPLQPGSTNNTAASAPSSTLPDDLRDQWLARVPRAQPSSARKGKQNTHPPRMPPGTDLDTRKRLLAQSLLGGPPSHVDSNPHPPCPAAEDLIGFVTAAEGLCLSKGRGTAIGSVSAERALEALRVAKDDAEGRLCVIRNAGETVGWLARWELI